MKIIDVVALQNCGEYAESNHWKKTRRQIHDAVKRCEWPIGAGSFTIYPESGKKRGEGNGVLPIRNEFVRFLKSKGWVTDGKAKNALGRMLGGFNAVLPGPEKPVAVEWETGNISSSHRSMNKLTMLVSSGIISAGVLAVPSRKFCSYLTDRIGNIDELEPYFLLWKSVPCESGILEIVVFEHDAESTAVPKIPKGNSGRAKG